MADRTLTYHMMPKQAAFVGSQKKYVMFSGGMGSGKTRALAFALLKQAVIPGNVILLLRKTMVWLKKSTLPAVIGEPDSVLPLGSYVWNKSEQTIRVNGGALIHVCGLEDPERIRSINAGAAYIDEAAELTEADFREVSLRLRHQSGSRQVFCCTNPAGPNHHLYKFYYLSGKPNREVITAASTENTFLPQDYVDEALGDLEGSQRRRLVEGQWCAIEGSIFDQFVRDTHARPVPKGMAFDEFICGVDYGYTHPTGIVLVGIAGSRMYVLEEFRKKGCLMRDIMEEVKRLRDTYKPTFVYDPSAAGLGGEMGNLGLNPFPANNDVAVGIDRIRNRLRVRNDSPDLVIADTCTGLISEMETYAYAPGTEKPVKVGDDLVDPLRYVVNYYEDLKCSHPHFPLAIDSANEDDLDMDR